MRKLYVYIVKKNPEKDMFLHCTSMNIVEESLPHVLFAMHLYSVWYLVMWVMFNSFPMMTWPLLTFSQKTVKGGDPVVTLHSINTFLPSLTVTFCTRSMAAGTWRNKQKVNNNNNNNNNKCKFILVILDSSSYRSIMIEALRVVRWIVLYKLILSLSYYSPQTPWMFLNKRPWSLV